MYESYIPKYYVMDPNTEDVLMGDQIEEGMVVVIEDPEARTDVSRELTAYAEHNANKNNRFCTVTKISCVDGINIRFIGVYSGGVKIARHTSSEVSWIVKLQPTSE